MMTNTKKSVILLLVVALASAIPIDQPEIVKTKSDGVQESSTPVVSTEKIKLNEKTPIQLIADNVKSVVDALREVNENAFGLVQAYVSRIVDVSKSAIFPKKPDVQKVSDPTVVKDKVDIIPAEASNILISTVSKDEVKEEKPVARDETEVETEPEKDKPNDEEPQASVVSINTAPLQDQQHANKIPNPLQVAFTNYKNAIHQLAHKVKAIPDAIVKKISSHLSFNAVVSPKNLVHQSETNEYLYNIW